MSQVIKIRRTLTPDTPPAALQDGELAAGLADVPIRMWIGTPTGVQELFAGTAVQDAPSDAIYGRCNGEWEQVPIVSTTPPVNPAPNSLWFDSVGGHFYLYFNDGSSTQWVALSGGAGPQGPRGLEGPQGPTGPQGPPGQVEEAPTNGPYLRRNGAWIPMTHARVSLAAATALPVNTWVQALTLDVGTIGTWLVMGSAQFLNAAAFWSELQLSDGVTIIAFGEHAQTAAFRTQISISGIITNPSGALRLSAASANAGTTLQSNGMYMIGNTPVTYLHAMRIG